MRGSDSRIEGVLFLSSFLPRWLCLLVYEKTIFPVLLYRQYWELSSQLLTAWQTGRWEPPHAPEVREPLYGCFLAVSRWMTGDRVFWMALLQVAVASVGCVYLYRLNRHLSGSKRVGILSGLLYAFYPLLVRQSVGFTYAPVFTTLLIASAYHYVRIVRLRDAWTCGLVFGLTVLTRAMILPAWIFGCLGLALRGHRTKALLVFATLSAVLLPFLMVAEREGGFALPTRSGENLFMGNGPYSDQIISRHHPDLLRPWMLGLLEKEKVGAHLGGKEANRFFSRAAWSFMRKHPFRTARLKILNVLYLFSPRLIPRHLHGEQTRVVFLEGNRVHVEGAFRRSWKKEWLYSLSYGAVLILALLGLLQRRVGTGGRDGILWLMAANFIVVHSVYFPSTFHRAPMDFILIFYSACVLDRWLFRV